MHGVGPLFAMRNREKSRQNPVLPSGTPYRDLAEIAQIFEFASLAAAQIHGSQLALREGYLRSPFWMSC
jgi:hypothetical protein